MSLQISIGFIVYNLFLLTLILISLKKYPHIIPKVKYIEYSEFSWNKYMIAIIIIVSFFYAFRNIELGSDFKTYVELYNKSILYGTESNLAGKESEYLYIYLNSIFTNLGISYEVFFGFIAAITWYFFIKGSYRFSFLLPLMVFFLLTSGFFFFSHSAIRQSIAIAIFFYSIKFIIEGKFNKYIIFILVASLFHQSALMLLPIYFLRKVQFNRNIVIILYILSFSKIIKDFIYQYILYALPKMFLSVDSLSIYGHYMEGARVTGSDSMKVGVGFFIINLAYFYTILKSKKILKFQPSLSIYYTIFFISVLLFNMFWNVELIYRLDLYLLISFVMVFSATIYYSITKIEKIFSIGFLFLFLLLYQAGIYKLYEYI